MRPVAAAAATVTQQRYCSPDVLTVPRALHACHQKGLYRDDWKTSQLPRYIPQVSEAISSYVPFELPTYLTLGSTLDTLS